nr:MAG TPA: hypothetical protein [Caudoviricetes sp.]
MSSKKNVIQDAYKSGLSNLSGSGALKGLGLASLVTKAKSPTDLTKYLTTGAKLLDTVGKVTSAVDKAKNASSKTSAAGVANPTEIPTAVYPTVTPRTNYSDMYSAYEQAMNARANAYNAMSNAEAKDVARQLQIIGNQNKNALYGTQGVRGQDVSETSLLQNEMSTGTTQSGVRSAYDTAMREVGMSKDQNLAETDRLMGNQQVNYENQRQELANQYLRDVDDFNRQKEYNAELKAISDKANDTIYKQQAFEDFGTDYSTVKAYNKAISKLKRDKNPSNDWKIEYLRTERDKLKKEVDKKKLAAQKNAYSKTLTKYKSTDQIDRAIAKILSDGNTSNDWKLPYLNKYRTILNRKEVAARKAAKAAKKGRGKGGGGGTYDGGKDDKTKVKRNEKVREKALKDLKGPISIDSTNMWNFYYHDAAINKKNK